MNNQEQNLIEILKQSGLAEGEQKKLLQAVNSMASDRILLAITKNLDDTSAKELEDKLNQNLTAQEIIGFLKEKLPNLGQIVSEELNQVKLQVINFLKQE